MLPLYLAAGNCGLSWLALFVGADDLWAVTTAATVAFILLDLAVNGRLTKP